MNIEIHTDGSIVGGNPDGAGGWACAIIVGSRERVLSGPIDAPTTNNRAELTAVIEALRMVPRRANITLYSDSEYVIKPLADRRIEEWAGRNFTKKKGKPKFGGVHYGIKMPNADLWERVNDLDIRHNVVYLHEDGHAGNHYNEIVHDHALSAARIAWECHAQGLPCFDLPETLEARTEFLELLKRAPSPPDPPPIPKRSTWAVFKRQSRYRFNGRPEMLPMDASSYPDGAKAYCEEAARRMNQSKWRDPETKTHLVGGEPMFEARPLMAPLDCGPFAGKEREAV